MLYTTLGLVILAIGVLVPLAHADISSPSQQLSDGTPMEQIKCSNDKILLQKDGRPACVYHDTASKLVLRGWTVVQIIDISEIVTTFEISSPVEFVDDGREYKQVIQRRPPPYPLYDRIMSSDYVFPRGDVSGTVSFSSPPHEKYSMNPGVGFYLED